MTSALTILAVDPATTTGWACSDGSSGAEDFAARQYPPRVDKLREPERHGCIGDRFAHWLDAKLSLTQASVLVVERQLTHGIAGPLLLGLRMVVLQIGWRRKLMVEEVWATQWRPWAMACGWWEKDDEMDARAMLGWWTEKRLPLLE